MSTTQQRANLKDTFAQFAAVYTQHRPVVQRVLNASFIFYVLFTTYRSVSARPTPSARSKGKGKGKGKEDDKKPARVAVSPTTIRIAIIAKCYRWIASSTNDWAKSCVS